MLQKILIPHQLPPFNMQKGSLIPPNPTAVKMKKINQFTQTTKYIPWVADKVNSN